MCVPSRILCFARPSVWRGEGSECLGFDDEYSRDHDWGPSFCIWLNESDYREYGARVQAWYCALSDELDGYLAREEGALSAGRVGCLCTPHWFRRYTGCPQGPQTLTQWRRVPESFLATATNGAVFDDPLGEFTAIREHLLRYYPEDVRIKKIVARAAVMAQAGQYNYPRCRKRGDTVAAQLALAELQVDVSRDAGITPSAARGRYVGAAEPDE